MATRAHVLVRSGKENTLYYRHYDGYPEGTGAELERTRGDVSGSEYELADNWHADVEYVYIVDKNEGMLEIRECRASFWDAPSLKNTKKLTKVNL